VYFFRKIWFKVEGKRGKEKGARSKEKG